MAETTYATQRLDHRGDQRTGCHAFVGGGDAASLVRLAARDQRGFPLSDDLLILPLAVEVMP
jgi:hypothetical protein